MLTSRGGTSRRRIGVSSPEAETIAVSSRRQRGHTKRTSCGDADQFERFTLAAIGQASQCEHDTRKRPGSSIPIPSDSASCPCLNDPAMEIVPVREHRQAQCAPLRVQEVLQVTVLPWSQALQAATHWFKSRGL